MEFSESENIGRFARINALYEEYAGIPVGEETVVAREDVRRKIIVEVCKMYFLGKAKNADGETYADEIVLVTTDCLKKFSVSTSAKQGIPFSRYVCASVSRKINSEKEKASLSDRNAGMKFSDDVQKKIRRVLQLDKHYVQFGIADEKRRNEKRRNEKIAAALEMSEEDVVSLKNCETTATSSLEAKNADGDEYSLVETTELSAKLNREAEPETALLSVCDKTERAARIAKIESLFDRQQERTKPYLAALLTRELLEELLHIHDMSAEEIAGLVGGVHFADKEIVQDFVQNAGSADWTLPTQQEIAARFGRDKTDASRTMVRFLEKMNNLFQKNA